MLPPSRQFVSSNFGASMKRLSAVTFALLLAFSVPAFAKGGHGGHGGHGGEGHGHHGDHGHDGKGCKGNKGGDAPPPSNPVTTKSGPVTSEFGAVNAGNPRPVK